MHALPHAPSVAIVSAKETIVIGPIDNPYALLLRPTHEHGSRFLTAPAMELQLGVIQRQRGEHVKAHTHPPRSRRIQSMSEFLYVESGRVEIQIFADDWRCCATEELASGDMVLLLRGGHALTVLDDARVIEVRLGPYAGAESDKRFAEADHPGHV